MPVGGATRRRNIAATLDRRTELGRRVGWVGDIPYSEAGLALPAATPRDTVCEFLLGWKQDNNSQTFIASPYPLTWLSIPQKPG